MGSRPDSGGRDGRRRSATSTTRAGSTSCPKKALPQLTSHEAHLRPHGGQLAADVGQQQLHARQPALHLLLRHLQLVGRFALQSSSTGGEGRCGKGGTSSLAPGSSPSGPQDTARCSAAPPAGQPAHQKQAALEVVIPQHRVTLAHLITAAALMGETRGAGAVEAAPAAVQVNASRHQWGSSRADPLPERHNIRGPAF